MTDERAHNEALVSAFAREVLDSFEKLEALMCIATKKSAAPHTFKAMCDHLGRSDSSLVEEALAGLVQARVLVVTDGSYALPSSGPWAEHVAALVRLHEVDLMRVVTLMSEAAVGRLRLNAERAFADAFIVGTKKKKGGPP